MGFASMQFDSLIAWIDKPARCMGYRGRLGSWTIHGVVGNHYFCLALAAGWLLVDEGSPIKA